MEIQLAMNGRCSYRCRHLSYLHILLPTLATLACNKRGRQDAAQSSLIAAARECEQTQATSDRSQLAALIGRLSASSVSAETLLRVASLKPPFAWK